MNLKAWLVLGLAGSFAAGWAGAAEIPRPEHPRPDQFRPAWQNLNGAWEFQADPGNVGLRQAWYEHARFQEQIQVPYPIESELSGLLRANPPKVNWYRLRFVPDPAVLSAPRQLLHFGAVDFIATVWLNGRKLDDHIGGYTPFVFEVSGTLKPGENILVVRVLDTRARSQVRGKQTWNEKPGGILYTGVTGIWQTVWLEGVGRSYIVVYKVDFDRTQNQVRLAVGVLGPSEGLALVAEVEPEGSAYKERHGPVPLQPGGAKIIWTEAGPKLWSPESPSLYSLSLILQNDRGEVVDRVEGYFGLRTIEAHDGKVLLNGKEFYQKLLLDQGYYPGGWYTAATDDDFRRDLETYKLMGFNGLRKHQKIEDPRFLYWCDRLGLVVWEEMPSMNHWLVRWNTKPAKARFQAEWEAVLARDYNHPSIIAWTIFNENWGIREARYRSSTLPWARELVRRTRELGGNRLVVDNSGGFHFDTDLFDFHQYLPHVEMTRELYPLFTELPVGDDWPLGKRLNQLRRKLLTFRPLRFGARYQGQPLLVSEYGGFGFYRSQDKSLLDNYREYTEAIGEFPRIVGYCYTQPYDVEQEQNGLMTFDRKPKVPVEEIRAINEAVGKGR